jgi:hypothetical protein
MIYATASTAEDIARLLRSSQESRRDAGWDDEEKEFIKAITPEPICIAAPRQSGKTTELLKFAEERNSHGAYTIICLSDEIQKQIIRMHWMIFNRISVADICAKRLLGEPLGAINVMPPLMLTPTNLHLLRGSNNGRQIFVDEWNALAEDAQRTILDSGRLVAAVTS